MSRVPLLASLAAALLAASPAARADDPAPAPAAAAGATAAPAAAAPSAADRAAAAAERAAEAAEKAADAAARSAAAAEKLAGIPAAAAPAKPVDVSKPPDAPPAPPPPPHWTGTVGLGLISLTGNSDSLTFKATTAFERKSEDWIVSFKGSAVYGQQRAPDTNITSVSALGGDAQLRGDRRLTTQLSVYLLAGIFSDHIASIEERPFGEVGVSLIWFDVKEPIEKSDKPLDKTSLRTDLGFRYGHEYRFQYYPAPVAMAGVDIIAPHLGVGYKYALNKDVFFSNDLDVVGNLVDTPRLLVTELAKISARLTPAVSLGVSFGVNYDSVPVPPKRDTDTALTIGLDVAL